MFKKFYYIKDLDELFFKTSHLVLFKNYKKIGWDNAIFNCFFNHSEINVHIFHLFFIFSSMVILINN